MIFFSCLITKKRHESILLESITTRSRTITIIEATHTNTKCSKWARKIAARRRPGWNIYTMNSDGGNTSIRRATPDAVVPTGMLTISSLYDLFETSDHDGFEIHIIIAKETASRTISFRPTSKRIGTGGLHGMMFFPSSRCNSAQSNQYMRLFGIYEEDYSRSLIMTTRTAFDKLHSEINHNLPRMAEATSIMGTSRGQIERIPVIDVGLHDRTAVDDTAIEDRASMLRKEFRTTDEIRGFLADPVDRFIVLTEDEPIRIAPEAFPAFVPEMNGTSTEACALRRQITQGLPERVANKSIQISWNEARYEKLHHLPSRLTARGEYNSDVVVGLSVEGDIHAIVWKDECRNLLLAQLREDTAYLFRTTKGRWRYFLHHETRRFGVLVHEECPPSLGRTNHTWSPHAIGSVRPRMPSRR